MPELPEVEGLATWLTSTITGRTIETVRMRSVAALKTFDPPLSALEGLSIRGATRRGKYLAIRAGDLQLVTHLSQAGWVHHREKFGERKPSQRGPIIAEVRFDAGGLDITEQGKEKRLALWVVRQLEDVPQIAALGPDALDPALGEKWFAETIRAQPGAIKRTLADQHLIAGIGNAYSDEILHAAKLSPFTKGSKLDDAQLADLFATMRTVLGEAVARAIERTGPELKDDKRTHLQVHARTGQACPVCGDTIRAVYSASRSFQYCPTCQTGGKVYADRRLSRLLK